MPQPNSVFQPESNDSSIIAQNAQGEVPLWHWSRVDSKENSNKTNDMCRLNLFCEQKELKLLGDWTLLLELNGINNADS